MVLKSYLTITTDTKIFFRVLGGSISKKIIWPQSGNKHFFDDDLM